MKKEKQIVDWDSIVKETSCKYVRLVNGTSNPGAWHLECDHPERRGCVNPMICAMCNRKEERK